MRVAWLAGCRGVCRGRRPLLLHLLASLQGAGLVSFSQAHGLRAHGAWPLWVGRPVGIPLLRAPAVWCRVVADGLKLSLLICKRGAAGPRLAACGDKWMSQEGPIPPQWDASCDPGFSSSQFPCSVDS